MIGAGSTVFVRKILTDLFLTPEIGALDIALMDIDADRLRTSETIARRLASQSGATISTANWPIAFAMPTASSPPIDSK
ncbi:MAG: hypothetical protein AAFX92_20675, partial [Pseudomonadota bacterium]